MLAPRLIEHRLKSLVETHTDLTLAIETVAVNPFNLALSFDNLTLLRPENTAAVSIDRVDARVRLGGSVAARAWLLEDVVMVHSRVDLGRAYAATAAELRIDPTLEIGPDGIRFAGDLELTSLGITDAESGAATVTVEALTADGVTADTSPSLLVDTIRLAAPRIRLQRAGDASLALPNEVVTLLRDPAPGRRMIAALEVHDGALSFRDAVVQPPAQLTLEEIDGAITQRRVGADAAVAVAVRGRIAASGAGDLRAEWVAARPAETMNVDLVLRDVELPLLSSYIAGAIGREVEGGVLDLELALDDAPAAIDNRLVIRNLELGAPRPPTATAKLPLELAAGLLEDATGSIAFSLPMREVRNVLGDPLATLSSAFDDYVTGLARAPFDYLAELVGRPDLELALLAFPAGSADAAGGTRIKLAALERALKLRPTLGMVVHGGYDRAADRAALARQQIRLHVTLAASARPPGETTQEPIDFDDPTVQSVLDEFAAERMSKARQAAVRARFAEGDTRYYRAVFEALIDNEAVPRQALERLARYRARTVVDALEEGGIDAARVVEAETVEVVDPTTAGHKVVRLEARPLLPEQAL